MIVRKVLNIEDMVSKHAAVVRALNRCGVLNVEHAETAMEALAMIEAANEENRPYHAIVTDMYFPMFPGEGESPSGEYVIEELENRGIDIPVIVCSSARMVLPNVVGCVHFHPRNDLDRDIKELIDKIRDM